MDNPARTLPALPSTLTVEPPLFLTIPEAVKLSRLSRATIYELMADQSVKSFSLRKKGNIRGKRLVSRESLIAFIESHAVTA